MGLAPIQAGQRITAAVANALPVTLSQLTIGSVASSTTETIIGTFTIPANAAVTGSGYNFHIIGRADSTGTPTLTLHLRINGVAGTQVGTQQGPWTTRSSGINMIWAIDGTVYALPGGVATNLVGHTVWDEAVANVTPTMHGNPTWTGNPATFDSTVPWTLSVTALWSVANSANIAQTLAGTLYPI